MTPTKPSTPPRPIRFRVIDSPIGPLTLAGTDRALTHICMQDQAHPPADQADWIEDPAGFGDVIAQLEAYFAGELTEFDIVLEREGDLTGRPIVTVTYQACSDTECLEPVTVELDVAIDVAD